MLRGGEVLAMLRPMAMPNIMMPISTFGMAVPDMGVSEKMRKDLDEPQVELRNYFPETWLWKLSRTGWVIPS